MSSDYQSMMSDLGINVVDDIVGEVVNHSIYYGELKAIQVALEIDFNISLSIDDIIDIMNNEGIDIGSIDYSKTTVQELIYESLLENDYE